MTAETIAIEYVPADSLNPAPYNPREVSQTALERLATLLDAHGWVDPIIARRSDSLVIGGHQRLKANLLRVKPDETVPVVFLDDIDDEHCKALNIALNNRETQGDYDFPMLADLLQDIDTGELDIPALTGFSEDDLAGLMHGLDESGGVEEDEIPEPQEDPVSRTGDLWVMGEHRLVCGDSTAAEIVCDCVVSDPPYGMNYTGMAGTAQDGMDVSQQREVKPIVGDGEPFDPSHLLSFTEGDVLLFGGDWFYDGLPAGGSWIVWDKRASEAADAIPGAPFEVCWSRRRQERRFIRIPWGGWNNRESGESQRWHPTQKPVAVMAEAVKSAKGEIVADPYAGSGTTIIACEQLGRKCYAVEIEPRYVDVGVKRWQNLTGKQATLDGDGRTFEEIEAERHGEG